MTEPSKYFQRMSWPQLLIFEEKHSNRYYVCMDAEAVGRACLIILEERLDPRYGYIGDPGSEGEIYGLKEEMTREAALGLPEQYRKDALKVIKENARLRAERAKEIELFENAKKAVKEKDGNLAFEVLQDRGDGEYEGFTFEEPTIP